MALRQFLSSLALQSSSSRLTWDDRHFLTIQVHTVKILCISYYHAGFHANHTIQQNNFTDLVYTHPDCVQIQLRGAYLWSGCLNSMHFCAPLWWNFTCPLTKIFNWVYINNLKKNLKIYSAVIPGSLHHWCPWIQFSEPDQ